MVMSTYSYIITRMVLSFKMMTSQKKVCQIPDVIYIVTKFDFQP